MTLHDGHVDYGEHVFPIILHLGPLVSMDHILDRILVEAEPLPQISQLLVRWALRVNPEHLTGTDLLGKSGYGLGRGPFIGLEKSESNQPTGSAKDDQIK